MEWIEVFIATTRDGLEPVSGFLYQCGLTGLQIEDNIDFAEFLNDPNREWDYVEDELVEQKAKQECGITFFVCDNIHGKEQLANIQGGLIALHDNEQELDLGSLIVQIKNIKEEDWANNWKKYFKPFPVGKKLMIRPSWEELPENIEKIVLKIDPGHIFGTGTHETTRLCMELIEEFVKENDNILDIGCGSGILSIASLLLGAKKADAIDIDPNAIDIAYENANMNDIEKERYCVLSGNILTDDGLNEKYSGNLYDVVEANIVADLIIALSEKVPNYIKKGGIFIASGIIRERLDDVYAALDKNSFLVQDTRFEKSWVAIASRYDG